MLNASGLILVVIVFCPQNLILKSSKKFAVTCVGNMIASKGILAVICIKKTLPAALLSYLKDRILYAFNINDPEIILDIGNSYWLGSLRDRIPLSTAVPLYNSLIKFGNKTKEEVVAELAEAIGYKNYTIESYLNWLSYREIRTFQKSLYYHLFQELAEVLHTKLQKASLENKVVENIFIAKLKSDFPFDSEKKYSLYDVFWTEGPRELGMVLGTKTRDVERANKNRNNTWDRVQLPLFNSMIVWLCPSNRVVRMVMNSEGRRGPNKIP